MVCLFDCLFVSLLFFFFLHISFYRLFNAKSFLYKETVLFETIQFCRSTKFNGKKNTFFFQAMPLTQNVLIQLIKFSIRNSSISITSIRHKYAVQFYLINAQDPVMCYPSRSERTWERWQWRYTPHSSKHHHYWNLTIRFFSVVSWTLVEGSLTLQQESSRCIL